MKILITGAGGMVAKAAIKHCLAMGDEVVSFTRSELDISNRDLVLSAFEKENPAAVLNCAAFTDVDGAETNVEECFGANAEGVENLGLLSKRFDAAFVTISTDYVFDGRKNGPYTQEDMPNPLSVYAKSKLQGEMQTIACNANSIIVRTGWIFGDGGKNFLSVMPRLLAEGRPIKAITDSFGTPTYADDLARRIRELSELDQPTIFHVVNSGPGASYYDFAEKVCEVGGFDRSLIEAVSAKDLMRPAPRPVNSRLACLFSERLGLAPMPDWEESLTRFIEGENA